MPQRPVTNIFEQLISGAVRAIDANRTADIGAGETGVAKVEPGLERVGTMPGRRRKVKDLEQFISPALAVLPVKPPAEISFGRNPIRRATVAKDVAVKLLNTETRLQQSAGPKRCLFVEGDEPPTLVEVCSRVRRVKGVEVKVVEFLRKDGEAAG